MAHGILLVTLNAKYMHASLGLRYLQANMQRYGGQELSDCTQLHEFTLQSPVHGVVDTLVKAVGPVVPGAVHIVGFGVYIWNVQQTLAVMQSLRELRPDIRLVLGGPEVSQEWEGQSIVQCADFLITGWGDVSFPRLCSALVSGPQPLMKVITSEQPPLSELEFPYDGYSAQESAHRVLYVAASRGCTFTCAFCLRALDQSGRAFE